MEIRFENVYPNPYRDFDIYPIDEEQVELLGDSIEQTGFWGGIVLRPHPTKGKGYYEMACGHHRKIAALSKGIESFHALQPRDLTDEEMVDIMIRENLTQRGFNAAAILDSVAAEARMAVRAVFASTNVEAKGKGGKSAITHLKEGDGIGVPAIMGRLHGELTRREVEESVAQLKDTGKMAKIIAEEAERIDAEVAAAEEAERKAQEEAEAAKKAAEKAAEADKKEAAEAVAKAQDRVNKASQDRVAAQSRSSTAKAAVENTEAEPAFDERCISLFDNMSQAESYRKSVTSPGGRDYIPFDQQYPFAQQVLDYLREVNSKGSSVSKKNKSYQVSAVSIQNAVRALILKMIRDDKRVEEAEKARLARLNQQVKLDNEVKNLRNSIVRLQSSGVRITKLYKEWDFDEDPTAPLLFKRDIDQTIKVLEQLRNYAA